MRGQLREVLTFAPTFLISIGIFLEKAGSRGNFPNTAHLGNTAHLAISAPGDRREISDT